MVLQAGAHRQDMERTVQDIFQTMLGLEITTTEAQWPPQQDFLSVTVHYAGTWTGAVLIECTPPQAFRFTARLMASEPAGRVDEDVRDAMGELANMIAGNLKPVLPHGVHLSMPSLVEGSDYSLWICGGNAVDRLAFHSEAGVFWVTLVELLEKPPGGRRAR
jgi:chemotaxis protein CheX